MSNKIIDENTEKNYKFLFSVIIPVYNVEQYVGETIESVINQSIGFENIQIILVNDGSPDNSEEICLSYKNKYPDNIIYVKQENAGVSSARNTGIKYIEGKYVNFLDSDDCWDPLAFERVNVFFEEHYDEVDVVGARKRFFDAKNGFHRLDYKFKKTCVLDLKTDYEFIQMDVTGAFIKADAIGENRFYTNLKYGEDAQFVNSIILEKCTVGVVRGAVHLYRKRPDESSALQNELKSDSYYFDSPEFFHKDLMNKSIEKYGRIIEYVQYMIMYDLQWRIQKPLKNLLPEPQYEKYRKILVDILSNIDDRVILNQKSMYMNMKIYALSLKHGEDIRKKLVFDHNRLLYDNFSVLNLVNAKTLAVFSFIDIIDNVLYIEGKDNCWLENDTYDYFICYGEEIYRPTYYDCARFDVEVMDGIIEKGRAMKFAIPLAKDEETQLKLFFTYKGNGNEEYNKDIYFSLGKFAHIPPVEDGYYVKDNFILKLKGRCMWSIPYSHRTFAKFERLYQKSLRRNGKGYLIKYRKLYHLFNKLYKKKIWLISDRVNKANDNGEHLFKYINSIKPKDINVYYYINKSSEDYKKMKGFGKVIPYDTPLYRLYFLLSDKIISSSGNEYVINAFNNDKKYLSDLYNFDYVFLQHGVTKDDLSDWVCKYNKNIKALVTAGRPEYKSFCEGNYYYSPDIPILSGFPRHDNLIRMQKEQASESKEKKILVIPTWRKSIKGSYDPSTGESIYYDGFKNTDYFRFYNSLISDKRLCDCMKKHGYKGLFCMHPSHTKQYVDFTPNDVFTVNHGYVDYQKEFTESSLLVTDYSSVFFDFAYLKKPIVYSQFDKDEFFAGEHAYKKGYFSYEDNGFGPVCYDLDSTVNAMIAEIENDCGNDPKYIKRIEEFYPYFDENSCSRVYEYIRKIPK